MYAVEGRGGRWKDADANSACSRTICSQEFFVVHFAPPSNSHWDASWS